MPQIISYPAVLQQMQKEGLKSVYHNSGAFGFVDGTGACSVGWIGEMDSTLTPAARLIALQLPPPIEQNLTDGLQRMWQEHLRGPVWAMPKSHWAYEFDFGSRSWMPDLLRKISIDPQSLVSQNNAAAIEFAVDEAAEFRSFVLELLTNLAGSDFSLAFPGHQTVCTVHHHKQIWWTTADEQICRRLKML